MVLERWDVIILDENGNSCNRYIEFEDDIKVDIYTNFIEWAHCTSPRYMPEKVSKILNNC